MVGSENRPTEITAIRESANRLTALQPQSIGTPTPLSRQRNAFTTSQVRDKPNRAVIAHNKQNPLYYQLHVAISSLLAWFLSGCWRISKSLNHLIRVQL